MMMRRDEGGQLTPMIIGFVVIALIGLTVVTNASKAFLYRRSLASWADGAAIVAAQSVSEQGVYSSQLDGNLPLAEGVAESAVGDYVLRHGLAGRFDDFAVEVVDVDTTTAAVTVGFSSRVPLVWANDMTAAVGGGMPIAAEATAVGDIR